MHPIRLLLIALAAALAWSGWWGWSAWQAKAELRGWLDARREAGWLAEWSSVSVAGFPNRVDLTIDELVLADPESGWVWTAPFFQILRLSYDKDHVILVWPDSMGLQTPSERIEITGEKLQASASFLPGAARELEEAVVVFRGLTLRSDAGWESSATSARLGVRPNETDATLRDIGIEIAGFRPSSPAVERLVKAGLAPGVVEQLAADLTVRFDAPWDRDALEVGRPQPREIEIHDMAAKWGKLEIRVAGDLTVDPDGRPSGDLLVKATNWEEILELARQSGRLPDAMADTVESALRLLSGLAGSSRTLDIPLSLDGRRVRAGPVPLGPVPVIRLP